MEIIQCTEEGVQGWKYGENGECHIVFEGKQRAFRDRAEAKAEEFVQNPAPLPVNNEPEENEIEEEQIEQQNNEEQAPQEQNQNSDGNSEPQQP